MNNNLMYILMRRVL